MGIDIRYNASVHDLLFDDGGFKALLEVVSYPG
jgi:hypothetical protein